MPVMKTQEIQCLECKDVLLAVMGERKTLVCSCGAVKVNVHSNYISTESNSDNYELGEIQEIDSSYVPLLPNPCLLYTSPSPRDQRGSRMPSSA